MKPARGIVYLVGAGPGDPGLITVRGKALLRRADVVIHDRLVADALLNLAPKRALRIDVGKSPTRSSHTQIEINRLLIEHASRGQRVVRLKGGDPFVFGRGSEELDACRDAGIPCTVVPGVTSAIAVPASVGVAVTRRGMARSFAVITARSGEGEAGLDHDFTALAKLDTLVVMMGRQALPEWTRQLLATGKSPDTPVCCVSNGTTARQRSVTGSLESIVDVLREAGLESPMVTVVGETVTSAAIDELLHPLAGKRVLLTAADDTNRSIADELALHGAQPIACSLIRINYTPDDRDLRKALRSIGQYNWIAFTSRHGVIGFFKALRRERLDARSLAGCRIAAVGRGTARALRRIGLRADLIPDVQTGEGLANALTAVDLDLPSTAHSAVAPIRTPDVSRGLTSENADAANPALTCGVPMGSSGDKRAKTMLLWPTSDRANRQFADQLRSAGMHVDQPIAYQTVLADANELTSKPDGIELDAVVLCSPSAVVAYRISPVRDALHVAIGEVTAKAAREVGIIADAVATSPSPRGIVEALQSVFVPSEVIS